MTTISVDGKSYDIEFTFKAVKHHGFLQKTMDVLMNGADASSVKNAREFSAFASNYLSDIQEVCVLAFEAGVVEEIDSEKLMIDYMTENKLSFPALWREIQAWMENDGFFEMSGLTEFIETLSDEVEKMAEEEKPIKKPQDHKKPKKKSENA